MTPVTGETGALCKKCYEDKLEKRRKERVHRKTNNLCVTCGLPNNNISNYCSSHAEKNKKWHTERKKQFLCLRCGKQQPVAGERCDDCSNTVRINSKNEALARKEQGLCVGCDNKASAGQIRCEECKEKHKKSNKQYRIRVIEYYGNKCLCCGESQYEFLTIDHINGGGTKHREEVGSAYIWKWIIDNNFPADYQVLCYNCNCGKEGSLNKGVCPHKYNYTEAVASVTDKKMLYRLRRREKAFQKYGVACKCCGENRPGLLTMDHIDNNGAEHRKIYNIRSIYQWLIKSNFPDGFQTMCFNCNCARGHSSNNKCPHEK